VTQDVLTQGATDRLNPIRYEMFRHRMYNTLEEGRIAVQQVSGSPVVVEGGECMSSFYRVDGKVILTAAGLLLHTTGCEDAIRKIVEWYTDDPGIHEGDQIFFNDPYYAGTHVFDMIVVKPIFWEGEHVAWTGCMLHTADAGGVLRGSTREIFHEGIRIQGLKIVENDRMREDVFRVLTEQCRDPAYVGLDIKARIAANNVCERELLALFEEYGHDFALAAMEKVVEDTEKECRARLAELPDGVWRSRFYNDTYKLDGYPKPFKAVCEMTKQGDTLAFDFSGSSPQNEDAWNATTAASWSGLFQTLSGFLFWDASWNGGMIEPITLTIPEGTFLNCRFPAACNMASQACGLLATAAHECVSKMLFAGGHLEDVNAPWMGRMFPDRPRWGGRNQHGRVVPSMIYDAFASGTGAGPGRDGVHTGAHPQNPESKISDTEVIELNYPFITLGHNQLRDSGGWGAHSGGMGFERLLMVRGTEDLTDMYGLPLGMPTAKGIFGGYPGSLLDWTVLRGRGVAERLAQGDYPSTHTELTGWGTYEDQHRPWDRIALHEYDIELERGASSGAGGYGDPLRRDPRQVAADVAEDAISAQVAEEVYGVALDDEGRVDEEGTASLREGIRKRRMHESERLDTAPGLPAGVSLEPGMRIHEYLELRMDGDQGEYIVCRECDTTLCSREENYKRFACRRVPDYSHLPLRSITAGDEPAVRLQEYMCPGCHTMLEVDLWCPELDSEEPLWDIDLRTGP
jgi:N-methylhydantoinase B